MQSKTKTILAIMPIFLVLGALLGVTIMAGFVPVASTDNDGGIVYKGRVCTTVTRANGDVESLGCTSNLLTDAGANAVRTSIGQGGDQAAFDFIALCNSTIVCANPAAGDTTLANEITAGGLVRTQGAFSALAQAGNWSIQNTFTAGETVSTNKTGLFNGSTGNTLLAANTFATVTLNNLDQLTVNWTITASDGG